MANHKMYFLKKMENKIETPSQSWWGNLVNKSLPITFKNIVGILNLILHLICKFFCLIATQLFYKYYLKMLFVFVYIIYIINIIILIYLKKLKTYYIKTWGMGEKQRKVIKLITMILLIPFQQGLSTLP